MKKLFIFAFVIALLMCFSISVSATEEKGLIELDDNINLYSDNNNGIQVNQTYLDNFAVHYFYNLHYNKSFNAIGTCSYVATTMLLSYYDTYWNDNIIDEKYEMNNQLNFGKFTDIHDSPGIKSELSYYTESYLISCDYWNLVESEADNYFHFYLLQLARDHDIASDVAPNSLGPYAIKELLEYYLFKDRGLANCTIDCEQITGFSDIRSYAIEKVKQGIPVIVCAKPIGDDGHTFIIYDYDEDGDELYCHVGWEIDETHIALSSLNYTFYCGAVSINLKGSHSHSNNYVDKTTGQTYCSCYFPCHPEHKCTYTSDDDCHTYSCGCKYEKDVISFEHEYEYKTTGDKCHILTCTICGKTTGTESTHIIKSSTIDGNYAMCSICGAWVYKGGNTIFPTQPFKKEWEIKMVEAYQKY